MPQLTIVPHGESAAVILPAAVLESVGLHIGDILDVSIRDRQLILRSVQDVPRSELLEAVTQDVFERRKDAYQRLA
jgi:antitoxin component of MazEF toxin-antitoxin module